MAKETDSRESSDAELSSEKKRKKETDILNMDILYMIY